MNYQKDDQKHGMSRREFLKTAGTGAISLGLGSAMLSKGSSAGAASTHTGNVSSKPPAGGPYNILFILVDQESYFKRFPHDLQLPGHERLKRTGVSFENHYICSSVCTPSRSTIFTGPHIPHSGMFDNTNFPWQKDLSHDIPTLGHMMRRAGYYTVYKGKWHLSEEFEQPAKGPWRLLREEMEQYGFADYDSLGDLIGHTLGGYQNDQLVAGNAIRWFRTRGEELRQKNQPWFMVTSLVNPHDIMYFNADAPGENVQDNGKLAMKIGRAPNHSLYKRTYDYPLPNTLFQPFTEKGRPPTHIDHLRINNMWLGTIPPDKTYWKRFQDYYFNCIADVDVQIKRLLEELDNQGLTDNTIVILTSDHGEMRGAHGMRNKGQNAYEEDNHVPFIIVHPESQGGQKCQAITTHVDIAPTILSLAGASREIAKDLVGKDIAPFLTHPAKTGVNDLRLGGLFAYNMACAIDADYWLQVLKYLGSGGDPKKLREQNIKMNLMKRAHIRSIFDGRYKFSRYFSPKQHNRPETLKQILGYNDLELFDLQEDPFEERNLGANPQGNMRLILAMNEKLNTLIDEEIVEDIGQMLPGGIDAKWAVTKFDF